MSAYDDARRPVDIDNVFSAPSLPLPENFTVPGRESVVEIKRVVRGTYDILAYWSDANGVEVGRKTLDISTSIVGTVEETVVLALRDVSFTVVDRQNRPWRGCVQVSHPT